MAAPRRFKTKRDIVAEAIRRDILNGVLKPGSQLLQEEIAARLGVSPTPVREAFGALQAEGFLENLPHRGVYVANPSYADLIDIYDVRALVEGLALRRAVANSRDTARKLLKLTSKAQMELKLGNVERIRRSTNEFHQVVIDLAQSATLTEIAGKLVARSLFFLPFELAYMEQVQGDHVAIAEAVRQGQVDAAVDMLAEHHRRHAERLRTLMQQGQAAQTTRLTA